MRLAERLRHVLDENGRGETVLLEGDDRGVPFSGDVTWHPAAVLMAVTDRPDPGVVLTLRDARLKRHSGQVAFPGGRIDPEDEDAIAAALREAEEEIGLDPAHVELVGAIDRYRTRTGYDVTPVIGVIPAGLDLVARPGEVAAIFEVPLATLLDPRSFTEKVIEFDGAPRSYLEMTWHEYRIWGATAAIIANIGHRLKGLL